MIVIGFGFAGYYAVKAMRDGGYTGEIMVCTDVTEAPCNPMLSTYYVGGKIGRAGQMPFGGLEEIAERYHLTICRKRVALVNATRRIIQLEDGTEQEFERLLICTGARAFLPNLGEYSERNVVAMRTMEDADRLYNRLKCKDVRSAIIVGASMTGIKVVELLHKRGIHCTLVDAAQSIFPLSTLPETARKIETHVSGHEVDLMFGTGISEICEKDNRLEVIFSNGKRQHTDLVALCVGTRANTELVDTNEIAVDRGILVNSRMETSAPYVYAAGDCSAGTNLQTGQRQIIGLLANAAHQGECAGKNMIGVPAEYEGTILHNITAVFGEYFIGLGDNRCAGQHRTFTSFDGKIFVEMMKNGHRIECINLFGGYEISGIIKAIFVRQLNCPGAGVTAAEAGRLRAVGFPDELLKELGV